MHFEKMLHDNAQLARVYLHAWQITRDDLYRRIAEETLDYVARDTGVLAAMHSLSIEEVEKRLAAARRKLFGVREGRIKPARYEKVLTGWNGLVPAAFAEPARVSKREDPKGLSGYRGARPSLYWQGARP